VDFVVDFILRDSFEVVIVLKVCIWIKGLFTGGYYSSAVQNVSWVWVKANLHDTYEMILIDNDLHSLSQAGVYSAIYKTYFLVLSLIIIIKA